jgi:hypothetical protein
MTESGEVSELTNLIVLAVVLGILGAVVFLLCPYLIMRHLGYPLSSCAAALSSQARPSQPAPPHAPAPGPHPVFMPVAPPPPAPGRADAEWATSVALLSTSCNTPLLTSAMLERFVALLKDDNGRTIADEAALAEALSAGLAPALLSAMAAAEQVALYGGDMDGACAAVRAHGLWLLTALADGLGTNAAARRAVLVRAGALNAAVSAGVRDSAAAAAACAAISALLIVQQVPLHYGEHAVYVDAALECGAVDFLSRALELNLSPAASAGACVAIARLAALLPAADAVAGRRAAELLIDSGAVRAVVAAMQRAPGSIDIQIGGARALTALCCTAAPGKARARVEAASAGAIQVLCAALLAHAAASARLVMYASSALYGLALGTDANAARRKQHAVYDAAAFRALAGAMCAQPNDAVAQALACAAVCAIVGVGAAGATDAGAPLRQQAAIRDGALAAVQAAMARFPPDSNAYAHAATASDGMHAQSIVVIHSRTDRTPGARPAAAAADAEPPEPAGQVTQVVPPQASSAPPLPSGGRPAPPPPAPPAYSARGERGDDVGGAVLTPHGQARGSDFYV